jgi:uncharacterized protein with HEPN domain
MSPADRVRLEHMLEAALDALSFASGRSRQDLAADRMLLFSLERAFEIMGEAAGKVSAEFRSANPEIPWADIVGMRHRLIHAYFDVNLDIVWTTVASRLPELARSLERMLARSE